MPIYIEARSDYAGGMVKTWREEILNSQFKGKPLFGSFQRMVWLVDGVNEISSNLFATFIEGWRSDIQKKECVRVIFSSREGESPAHRLELDNVFTVGGMSRVV